MTPTTLDAEDLLRAAVDYVAKRDGWPYGTDADAWLRYAWAGGEMVITAEVTPKGRKQKPQEPIRRKPRADRYMPDLSDVEIDR